MLSSQLLHLLSPLQFNRAGAMLPGALLLKQTAIGEPPLLMLLKVIGNGELPQQVKAREPNLALVTKKELIIASGVK